MSCTVSHNKTCRYPYDFIYEIVPITATPYPKIRCLTSKLPLKMKNFRFLKYSVYRHPITCYTPPCQLEGN